MPDGGDCGFCAAMLDSACEMGVQGACDLRGEYIAGTIPPEDAILKLADLCTPDQAEAVEREAVRRA